MRSITLLRTLQAALSFDSWAQPSLALGMRSTATELRHLLYSVDGRDIDLRVVPSGAEFAISGQVLGPDEHGVVELAPEGIGGRTPLFAALDALGEISGKVDNERMLDQLFSTFCIGK